MDTFDILRVPARRRILELLGHGERTSGELVTAIHNEFGLSQPAVSQHLGVLRDNGFTSVRAEGARRIYTLRPDRLAEIDTWLESFRGLWIESLESLAGEVERGQRERKEEEAKRSAE